MLYVASVCISWFGGDEGRGSYVNVLSFLLCCISLSGGEIWHVIDLSSQQIQVIGYCMFFFFFFWFFFFYQLRVRKTQ